MKKLGTKFLGFLLAGVLALGGSAASAAIYWVGDNTPACDAISASSTLAGALLLAAFSAEDDEVRLTKTINYVGNTNTLTLTNWNPNTTGKLTLAGGYSDCNSSQNGRTEMGGGGTNITINTTTQPASDVTFKNLRIKDVPGRAVKVTGGGAVLRLVNTVIDHNDSGISITNGGNVSLDANSSVEDHLAGTFNNSTNNFDVEKGGGIYCTDSGSRLTLTGDLIRNAAQKGGGLYVGSGCFVEIINGARIIGSWQPNLSNQTPSAIEGGAIYVDDGGSVVSGGGSSRVQITNHRTLNNGAGIYVRGSSLVLLVDVRISRTAQYSNGNGTAIFATDGGTGFPQVILDRSASCVFGTECTLIDQIEPNNNGSVVYASNSRIDLNRTVLKSNGQSQAPGTNRKFVIHANNGSEINLDTVGLINNAAESHLFVTNGADLNLKHVTAAANDNMLGVSAEDTYFARVEGDLIKGDGELDIRNSLLNDEFGFIGNSNRVSGSCNFIKAGGWPALVYNGPGVTFGQPVFKDISSYLLDPNQTEPGTIVLSGALDACAASDTDNTKRDIEYQLRPVDNPDSPNAGIGPNVASTIWDIGYDEVILPPQSRTLNITFTGGGSGQVTNNRIATCTSTCTRQIDPGGVLTLTAVPNPGNSFVSWSGCNSVVSNQCTVDMVTQNASVTVEFSNVPPPDDLFEDSFEN